MKLKFTPLVLIIFIALRSSSQNVGIGNTSPGTKLDVNGAITLRETALAVVSNAAAIPSNVSQVRLTGSTTANITLTSPAAPPNAGQDLIIYNNTTGGFGATFAGSTIPNGVAIEFIYSNSTWVPTVPATSTQNIYTADGTLAGNRTVTMAANNLTFGSTTGNLIFSPSSTGKAGIGTASPLGNLDVEATTVNSYGHLVVNRSNAGAVGGELSINNNGGGTGAAAVLAFGTDGSTNFDGSGNNLNNAEIRAVNNNGTTNSTDLYFSNWSGSSENVNMDITSGGLVGIGTTTPAAPLEISSTGDIAFLQLNTTATANKRTRINFSQTGTIGMEIGTDYLMGNTNDLYIYNRATGSTAAYFDPGSNVWLSARGASSDLYLNSSGNVGIGTTSPAYELDVAGTEHVGGVLTLGSTISSSKFRVTQVWNQNSGLPALNSSAFTSGGGTIVINASGSGYSGSQSVVGMNILVDGVSRGVCKSYTNETSSHKSFTANFLVVTGLAAGTHSMQLTLISPTATDFNDFFSVSVMELPF